MKKENWDQIFNYLYEIFPPEESSVWEGLDFENAKKHENYFLVEGVREYIEKNFKELNKSKEIRMCFLSSDFEHLSPSIYFIVINKGDDIPSKLIKFLISMESNNHSRNKLHIEIIDLFLLRQTMRVFNYDVVKQLGKGVGDKNNYIHDISINLFQ